MTHTLRAPEDFATSRLLLRKPRLDDAGAIFRNYATDSEVVRYLSWQPHKKKDETRRFLEFCLGEWSNQASYPYAIEMTGKESGPIGMIHFRPQAHDVQFGYVLARPYWGRGYMTEALKALVDWSLDQPAIWRAAAICDADNMASARVMEKAGLTFEGILRRFHVHPNVSPEPRDCRVYAKVKRQLRPSSRDGMPGRALRVDYSAARLPKPLAWAL